MDRAWYETNITLPIVSEKEADIQSATLRLRKELQSEREKQTELQNEIKSFQAKLAEANQGLLAASRLSDQLEISQVTIASLKEESKFLF